LVLDCANLKDFSGITHNKAKLALGSLSIVFDLVFLVQHYYLYSGTTTIETNEQSEPLLPPTEGDTEEGMEREQSSSSLTDRTIFV
jgi:cystinosin